MLIARLAFAAVFLFIAPAVSAQEHHGAAHGSHQPGPEQAPAAGELKAAMDRMHEDMAVELTGDADADFIRGMIPHHQGAIDMAEIELKYGKDPEARKLAETIIAAQKDEVAMMKEWLAAKGIAEK